MFHRSWRSSTRREQTVSAVDLSCRSFAAATPHHCVRHPIVIRLRSSLLAATCIASLGCAKSSKPADEAVSSKPSKAERCRRIAKTTGQQAGLVLGLTAAALDENANVKDSVRDAQGAAEAAAREFEAKCVGWSDEAVDCLDDPMQVVLHRSRCEEALAEAFGHALPPKDVPEGPAPKWTFRFSAPPSHLLVAPSSTVVARIAHSEYPEDGDVLRTEEIVGVRDGAQLWRRPGWHSPLLVAGREDEVLVIRDGVLVALHLGDGSERWTWQPPKPKPGPDEEASWVGQPQVRLVARTDEGLLVGDSDARIHSLAFDGTNAKLLHTLDADSLDSDARLFVAPDGLRWLWEYDELRAFDESWSLVASLGARDSLSDVYVGAHGVILIIDEELVSVEGRACGAAKVAPSRWPHPNSVVFGDDDECVDCARPPQGCVRWQIHVPDLSASPIAVADGGRVLVNDDEALRGIEEGKEVWRTGISVGKQLVVAGDAYAVVVGGEDGEPTKLWKLSPVDGAPQWSSSIVDGHGAWMYSLSDVQLAASQTLIVAGHEADIAAFGLPTR